MLVKTYTGNSEREAIAQAKDDLGDEIMIVEVKRQNNGQSVPHMGRQPVILTVAVDPRDVKTPRMPAVKDFKPKSLTPPAKPHRFMPALGSLDETELAELFMLRNQLRSMKAHIRASRELPFGPPFDFCYGLLAEAGVPDHMAEALIQRSVEQLSGQGAITKTAAIQELKRQIAYPFLALKPAKPTGRQEVVALVGPSGAGKTSLITKLAAHSGVYRNRKTGIISTDMYRAGANAGLKSLARILNVPIIEVKQIDDLQRARKNLADYEVILVDTPGRSPLAKGCLPELQTQLAMLRPTETILVLSANMGLEELWLYMGLYQGIKATSLAVTKMDETSKPGKIMGLIDDPQLPLKYISNGQEVPNSLELNIGQAVIKRLPLTIDGV